MATLDGFRREMRTLLGDSDNSIFLDADLDTWRDEEVGTLWSVGLFKRGTNRGSEPTIRADRNGLITRYYSMPTSFRRISDVEFIDSGQVTPPVITLTTATTGGTLAAGLYKYRISVTDTNGETVPGPETAIVVPAGTATNTITLTWPTITVAAASYAVTTGYKIYGRSGTLLLQKTISSNTTATYLDTGADNPSGAVLTYDTSTITTDDVVGRSTAWDDLEDTGNVRVDAAQGYENFQIRMFGELEYTSVADPYVKQEVLDVILYGATIRALTAQYVQRINSSRSLVSTRELDASPGALAIGINTIRSIYKSKLAKARAVQAISTLVR